MNELGLFFVSCVLITGIMVASESCERRDACKDAPLADGCTHPDQRYTVVDGAKMCLCARDGGAK